MDHWFHRNPPKAAVPLKCEALLEISKNSESKEIITLLKVSRGQFLELVTKSSSTVDDVTVVFDKYLSLLRGLVDAPPDTGGESKLRRLTHFKWANSVGGKTPKVPADAWFEIISVVMQMAMWHTNHAANIFVSDAITLAEAKEVHRSLKLAAGMFLSVKDHLLPKLTHSLEKGVDTDTRVVDAYAKMSLAEAQEVTLLARALKLGHEPDVVIPLALETSRLFTMASDSLKTLDSNLFKKWTHYLNLKAAFNEAYAYCFFGKELLEQDKCGESVKVMEHSQALSEKAIKLCKLYAHTKKEMGIARPDGHPLFQKLAPMIKLQLDKSVRENGFIYHDMVPAELPAYEKKQEEVYGLVTPEDFALPPHHTLWTEEAYTGFHVEARDTSNGTMLLDTATATINGEPKKPSKSWKRTLSLPNSSKKRHSTSDPSGNTRRELKKPSKSWKRTLSLPKSYPSEEGAAAVLQKKKKKSIRLKSDTMEAQDEGSERADEVVESLQDCKPCDRRECALSDSAATSDSVVSAQISAEKLEKCAEDARKAEARSKKLNEAREILRPEFATSPSVASSVKLIFRLPRGERLERSFPTACSVNELYQFVFVMRETNIPFTITRGPNKELELRSTVEFEGSRVFLTVIEKENSVDPLLYMETDKRNSSSENDKNDAVPAVHITKSDKQESSISNAPV